jgi:predicted transcriptional regulator
MTGQLVSSPLAMSAAPGTVPGLSSPVRDTMTREVVAVSPEDTRENAMRLTMINNIQHLLVVDPAKPDQMGGFLTRTDMMRIYSRACRIL